MKRNQPIILLLCLLISVNAKSQFSKGDKLIGGAISSYSSNSTYVYTNNPGSNNSFGSGFIPRYSWVTKNNRMNGVFLNANYSHSKTTGSSTPNGYSISNYYSFGVGYFVRKYNDFNQQLGWFLEYNGVVSYLGNKQEQSLMGNISYYKSWEVAAGVNVSPGLYYRASRAVLVEAAFGGVNAKYSKGQGYGTQSEGFNIGLNFPSNFTFGLQFLVGRKQGSKS